MVRVDSQSSGPYRFVVVGSGWRSGVFLRLGTQYPDKLAVTSVVSHTHALWFMRLVTLAGV